MFRPSSRMRSVAVVSMLASASIAAWFLFQSPGEDVERSFKTPRREARSPSVRGVAMKTDDPPTGMRPLVRAEYEPGPEADLPAGAAPIVFTARFLSAGKPIVRGDVGVEFFRDEKPESKKDDATEAAEHVSVDASGVIRTVSKFVPPVVVRENAAAGSDIAVTDETGRAEFSSPFFAGPLDGGRAAFQVFGKDGGLLGALEISLPAWLPNEVVDLGIVELSDSDAILAGKVVDDTGRPIAAASVEIGRPPKDRRGGSVLDFVPLSGLHATTGRDGGFAVRGSVSSIASAAELRVRATAAGFLASTPATVLPGTTGLRLVLVRPSGLAMSFVHRGSPLDGLQVHVSLRPAKGEGRGWSGTADEFGKIVMADLPPGPVRVEVFVADLATAAELSLRRDPTTVVGPIELPAGDVCRDRRLNPFDLDVVVRKIRLRVETEDGQPASDVGAAIVERDASFSGARLQGEHALFKKWRASFAARPGKDGVIRLYAPNGPQDVAVAGWDAVPVLVRNVAAEDVVRLRKSRPFTVVLRGVTAGAATDGADRVVVETDCPADPADERSAIRILSAAHPTSAEFSAAGPGNVRYRVVRGEADRRKRSEASWRDGAIKADAEGRLTLTIDDY